MVSTATLIAAAFWVAGTVLAKGFWPVVLAEMLMQKFGWL